MVLCLSTYETVSHVISWKLFFLIIIIILFLWPIISNRLIIVYFIFFFISSPLLSFPHFLLTFIMEHNTFIMEQNEGFDHNSVYIKAFWVFSRHVLVLHFIRQKRNHSFYLLTELYTIVQYCFSHLLERWNRTTFAKNINWKKWGLTDTKQYYKHGLNGHIDQWKYMYFTPKNSLT